MLYLELIYNNSFWTKTAKQKPFCYVLDNVKMINYLQKEGVIGDDEGSCLIKSFLNKDDADGDHDSD